jgi:hypothetical protein
MGRRKLGEKEPQWLKRTLLLLSSVVLACVFAASALAAPPTTEVTEVELGDFLSINDELCGFPITFDESGSFKVKTFYDAEGNRVRTILTNFNDRYTATATANGKTLSTNYPLTVHTSFEEDEEDLRLELGLRNAYRVPGAGVVLLDAGRVIIDLATDDVLFEAGQHQFLNGDADAFCNYFASP